MSNKLGQVCLGPNRPISLKASSQRNNHYTIGKPQANPCLTKTRFIRAPWALHNASICWQHRNARRESVLFACTAVADIWSRERIGGVVDNRCRFRAYARTPRRNAAKESCVAIRSAPVHSSYSIPGLSLIILLSLLRRDPALWDSWMLLIPLWPVIFVLIVPLWCDWSAKKDFEKLPKCNTLQSVRFSEIGCSMRSEIAEVKLHWASFTRAAIFNDGVLLIENQFTIHWFPDRLFTETDFAALRDLVSRSVPDTKIK